jgi:hypothetical protein
MVAVLAPAPILEDKSLVRSRSPLIYRLTCHLNRIELTMELRQEDAFVSCFANEGLEHRYLMLEIFREVILEEDLVYQAVDCASQKYSVVFCEDSLVPWQKLMISFCGNGSMKVLSFEGSNRIRRDLSKNTFFAILANFLAGRQIFGVKKS